MAPIVLNYPRTSPVTISISLTYPIPYVLSIIMIPTSLKNLTTTAFEKMSTLKICVKEFDKTRTIEKLLICFYCKEMNLYQYKTLDEQDKTLDEQEQYNVLWSKGAFIDHRISASYNFLLYQIESFYVELKYNRDDNKIQGIRSFSSMEQLEPYLRKIKLPEM